MSVEQHSGDRDGSVVAGVGLLGAGVVGSQVARVILGTGHESQTSFNG